MPDDDLDPSLSEEAQEHESTPAEDTSSEGEPTEPGSALEAVEAALRRGEESEEAAGEDEPGEAPAAPEKPGEVADREPAKDAATGPDLTPPEGISAKARERFETLATGYRDLEARHERTHETLTGLQETLRETGAQPEELATTLEFLRLSRSQRPEDQEAAWSIIDQERRALAVRLGKQDAVPDILKAHPDLQQAVESLDITEAHALELARHREAAQLNQAQTQRTTEQAQHQQHVETLRGTLNALEARLSAGDGDWGKKAPYLYRDMPEIMRLYGDDPRRLVARVEQRYQEIGEMMQAAAPKRTPPSRHRQAISAGSPGGAPPSAPAKTTLDAITRAIGHGVDG